MNYFEEGIDAFEDKNYYRAIIDFNKAIEIESLNTFGCTTPFGPSKDKICTQDEGGNVTELTTAVLQTEITSAVAPL